MPCADCVCERVRPSCTVGCCDSRQCWRGACALRCFRIALRETRSGYAVLCYAVMMLTWSASFGLLSAGCTRSGYGMLTWSVYFAYVMLTW
eukprot:309667-Rhodomonas_salina.1